ncbi:hypothetical protein [Rahnella perminowiae]
MPGKLQYLPRLLLLCNISA